MQRSRRGVLGALAAVTVPLAGCTGGRVTGVVGGGNEEGSGERGDPVDAAELPDDAPPIAGGQLHLGHELAALRDASLSGGVGQDGIPSVDAPTFEPAEEADLDPREPVFAVVRGGEAKAYPQYVLVWHEIVNDTLDGDPVAVTYCPLTGTAQGFERGDTEFGVSGELVNSNLIMYDRSTESWWPQMLATAIDGPMTGATLEEFQVVWTTFGEWAAAYPDGEVLTDETGHARRYGSDPYGSYVPFGEYYANEGTLFAPLAEPGDGHPKSVVVGARTADGAVAFDKTTLLAENVLTGSIPGGDRVVAVASQALSTGYVYANPDEHAVEPVDDGGDDGDANGNGGEDGGGDGDANEPTYAVDGETYGPADLPLESVVGFDAMWFAWYGFYPDTAFVGEHTGPGHGR